MVSKASEDFPEPDKPVITTSRSRGISTSTFLRLCSRAPRTEIDFCEGAVKDDCMRQPEQRKNGAYFMSAGHCLQRGIEAMFSSIQHNEPTSTYCANCG